MSKTRHEHVPPGTGFAEFFSATSRLLKILPPLNHLIVGNNNVPAGWQVLKDVRAGHVAPDSAWVRFEGDPKGSRLPIPRLAKRVGIIAVEAMDMEELRAQHPDGQDAVALRFNDAVVVGALVRGARFASTIKAGEEMVAAGILRGDLTAIAGRTSGPVSLFNAADLAFHPALTSEYEWHGSISDLDSSIPKV